MSSYLEDPTLGIHIPKHIAKRNYVDLELIAFLDDSVCTLLANCWSENLLGFIPDYSVTWQGTYPLIECTIGRNPDNNAPLNYTFVWDINPDEDWVEQNLINFSTGVCAAYEHLRRSRNPTGY